MALSSSSRIVIRDPFPSRKPDIAIDVEVDFGVVVNDDTDNTTDGAKAVADVTHRARMTRMYFMIAVVSSTTIIDKEQRHRKYSRH
jgi:spore germination protein YaaH